MPVPDLSGYRCAHNNAANTGGSREVCLPALPPGARNSWTVLHSPGDFLGAKGDRRKELDYARQENHATQEVLGFLKERRRR